MKRMMKRLVGIGLCVLMLLSMVPMGVMGAETDEGMYSPTEKAPADWGPRSLSVVGSGIPGVGEWNPADPAGDMSEVSDNVYEIILDCHAGTDMKIKIAGNDTWDDDWNFGSASIVLGQWLPMVCGAHSTDMRITVQEACALRILVDLNPMYYGNSAQIWVGTNRYCVVGNADWMGSWDVSSDAGLMSQIAPGVHQRCFKNVAPGKYEFMVTKDGLWDDAWNNNGEPFAIYVGKKCDVTFTLDLREGEGVVSVDYARAMGDVTGDGRLNMGDVAKLYAHIRNTAPLTDQTALDCADFTADGKINIGDTARIYAYIRGTDPAAVVDAAYQLAENQEMAKDSTLTGKVLSIIEPYNSRYGCITLSMVVDGREDYPIVCSRLMGADGANISVNDNITVTGRLRNFYGTVEFKEGCQLMKWENVQTPEEAMAEIVDAAYGLGDNETMDHPVTLTGKVISVDQAYTTGVSYISVTIAVAGREEKPISCYRMVGNEIGFVRKDDTITVTGTLRNFYGMVEFAEGCRLENYELGNTGSMESDPLRIVDMAYALEKDTEMTYDVTLTGRVSSVKEAYDVNYKNISVIMQVAGRESKPILAFRMKGDGVDQVAVGDTVTVVGRLKNYNGTVQFAAGCTMTKRVSGGGTPFTPETDPAKILEAAQKLSENEELPYTVTLSGKVTSIDEVYNADYQNISVTIAVEGTDQTLQLYRLKGDGINLLAVNDTITVSGKIKNYYGELELVNGTMTRRISGGGAPVLQTDYKKIVDEAYALAAGASLPYTVTLEGKIVELQTPYDSNYKNMTVVIAVAGREDKPIVCYRMKGDNIGNHLCVGDTITVEGYLKNYVDSKGNSTVEFDAGCKMTNYKAGSLSKPTDPKQIVDAAFALGENEALPYYATLTGTVKSIDEPYSYVYMNMILTMTVQGTDGTKDIVCYRLKGDGADALKVGSTITVTGAIKRYVNDKNDVHEDFVEFDSGCFLES